MLSIHPHQGVGSIRFGMTRSEIARTMGESPRRGRRSKDDMAEYDFFQKLALFVYYDAHDRCCAVEFTREAQVEYDGYELFAHPAHNVRSWARARDQDLKDKDGFVSTALGLSMYAPLIDEPDLNED